MMSRVDDSGTHQRELDGWKAARTAATTFIVQAEASASTTLAYGSDQGVVAHLRSVDQLRNAPAFKEPKARDASHG
jgi:hypothetical protein